ncbi:ComEA family DNA-binding protein [Nonomuraea sp. KC401]|nr:ComEA family DNA-binding protein [Nonomuraea sp. K271]NBE99354.1 hypothetical protein [Nonomuraea sp. K271]TLF60936.1 ComEA family DNA-binding protein [Nonomuraea sp. KC401]
MPYSRGPHDDGPFPQTPPSDRSSGRWWSEEAVRGGSPDEPRVVDGDREAPDEAFGELDGEPGARRTAGSAHQAGEPTGAFELSQEPSQAFDRAYGVPQPPQTARQRGPVPVPPTFQAFRATLASQSPSLDPGRPGLRVLVAVGAVATAVAVFFVWRSQPSPAPLPPPTPVSSPTPSTTRSAPKVTVHVAGKIRKPGVYLLPAGARVTDAVSAAGGVSRRASLDSLNLARRLVDGEQIVVGAPPGTAAQGSPVTGPAADVIDLNTATPDQLEQLPGVGEVLAARIAEFRTTHGAFTSIDQLREVSGIGPRKFDEIKPKVRV